MDSNQAKDILAGIVGLACKLSKANPKNYKIKIGGDQVGARADIDWYISVQNHDAYVNTNKAKEMGLIRRTFGIYREVPGAGIVLRVLESDLIKNGKGDYQLTWSRSADDMKSRKDMADLIAASILELRPSQF